MTSLNITKLSANIYKIVDDVCDYDCDLCVKVDTDMHDILENYSCKQLPEIYDITNIELKKLIDEHFIKVEKFDLENKLQFDDKVYTEHKEHYKFMNILRISKNTYKIMVDSDIEKHCNLSIEIDEDFSDKFKKLHNDIYKVNKHYLKVLVKRYSKRVVKCDSDNVLCFNDTLFTQQSGYEPTPRLIVDSVVFTNDICYLLEHDEHFDISLKTLKRLSNIIQISEVLNYLWAK